MLITTPSPSQSFPLALQSYYDWVLCHIACRLVGSNHSTRTQRPAGFSRSNMKWESNSTHLPPQLLHPLGWSQNAEPPSRLVLHPFAVAVRLHMHEPCTVQIVIEGRGTRNYTVLTSVTSDRPYRTTDETHPSPFNG